MDEVPKDRAEAQVLADKVGVAYYADRYTGGSKRVYRVTRDTPIGEVGDRVAYGNTWSRGEIDGVIGALNNAYQEGRRGASQPGRDLIREKIDEAIAPLIKLLEQHLASG
jgi:hypothetical protein